MRIIEYQMEQQYLDCLLYVVKYMHRHVPPDTIMMQAYSYPNNCVHIHIEVINKTIINNS